MTRDASVPRPSRSREVLPYSAQSPAAVAGALPIPSPPLPDPPCPALPCPALPALPCAANGSPLDERAGQCPCCQPPEHSRAEQRGRTVPAPRPSDAGQGREQCGALDHSGQASSRVFGRVGLVAPTPYTSTSTVGRWKQFKVYAPVHWSVEMMSSISRLSSVRALVLWSGRSPRVPGR